jgi:hypothetical protein
MSAFGEILQEMSGHGVSPEEKKQRINRWDEIANRNDLTADEYNKGLKEYLRTGNIPTGRTVSEHLEDIPGQTVKLPSSPAGQGPGEPSVPFQATRIAPEQVRPIHIGEPPPDYSVLKDGKYVKAPMDPELIGHTLKILEPSDGQKFVTQDQASTLLSPQIADKMSKAFNGRIPTWAVEHALSHESIQSGRDITLGEKEKQRLENRITLMGKDMDPTQYRSGAFGVSKQVFDRSERLSALANAFPDGNLDSRQIEELAIGLNAMLSGANTGAQEQVKNLVPKSVIGNFEKLKEYLVNDPQGMNQQAFVKRMLGSIEREKETSRRQMDRVRFQRLARYDDVRKHAPDEWENQVRSYGIQPEDYDAWKKGGYKSIDASAPPENAGGGYSDPEKEKRYQEWKKKNGL